MGARKDLVKFAKLSPIIADLSSKLSKNEKFVSLIKEYNNGGEKNEGLFTMKALPYIAECDETYMLLAVYFDKTEKEIEDEPIETFTEQYQTVMKDKSLASFFQSHRK